MLNWLVLPFFGVQVHDGNWCHDMQRVRGRPIQPRWKHTLQSLWCRQLLSIERHDGVLTLSDRAVHSVDWAICLHELRWWTVRRHECVLVVTVYRRSNHICGTFGCLSLTYCGRTAIRYSSTAGATSCVVCSAGQYSPGGSTPCAACSAGYFAAAVGTTTCSACAAGQYNPSLSQSSCQTCSAGQ